MKKKTCAFLVSIAVLGAAFAVWAGKSTPDKTYTNHDFHFSLKFPSAWNYDEAEKPKIEADTGFGFSVPIGEMGGFGKMCNVNFAENPKAGKDSDEPNIDLMVMEVKPQSAETGKKERKSKMKEERARSECVIVENRGVTWGGQRAQLMTQRCPETKKVKIGKKKEKITAWRWTTVVTMKRVKTQEMYNLKGEMLCTIVNERPCDEMPDKGRAEFNKMLKPARDKMIATTRFGR
jgi:hypothetical protein